MKLEALVIPATDEAVYDLARLSNFNVIQDAVGQPLRVTYTVAYYSLTHGEAPSGTRKASSLVIPMPAVKANQSLMRSIADITEAILTDAVGKSLLKSGK